MILKQIAQKVSDDTSRIIGYQVSISDENGYLIGVNDRSRIGLFDELFSIVIKERKLMYWGEEDAVELPNIYPGVAAPIIVNGEVLGAIGIIGKVEEDSETENYIHLLKNHIEMVCYEEIRKEVKAFEASSLDTLIHYILHFDKSKHDMNHVIRYGNMLGFDLNLNRICFIIEIKTLSLDHDGNMQQPTLQQFQYEILELIGNLFKDNQEDLIGVLDFEHYCILKTVPTTKIDESYFEMIKTKSERLNKHLESKYKLSALVAIGDLHTGINGIIESYQEALKTLVAGKRMNSEHNIYNYNSLTVMLEILLSEIPSGAVNKVNKKLRSFIEHESFKTLSHTFLMYCKYNMNLSETARKLFIHRNSLIYRLEKIKKLTGLDIAKFEDCLLLYITIKNLSNENINALDQVKS
ncbi:sugar diacid recognition domain-containing protein [Bacillus dakarensis]|uniref:sugar diacid recognition domain-containing protein n=1 Tax=Robertmurraya dakarensis TaxID=1926278 RepID=UPI000981DBA6|nr:sugar diacid recognition domain-containing protein [Bacillus dakarensis]